MTTPLLQLTDIRLAFGRLNVLKGVSFDIYPGEIVALVGDAIARKSAAQWLEQLEAAGIPAGPINRVTQALGDVQAKHRQMVRMIAGIPLVGSPVRFDGSPTGSDLPPPGLGEHTDEVAGSLGLGTPEITRLKSDGVLGA